MAEFKSLKYFLTKLPTTPAHVYREVYTDLFALFNSFRKLLNDLDEALLDYLTDAPEDGKTYGRKDGEWTEVTGGGGGGTVETVVAGSGISVDDTDPANPIVSSTVNPFVEAPEDGQLYGRKDADWEVVPATSAAEWGDIAGTLSDQTDLATALSGKEPSITAGTTSQYWRGDKTWQTLPSPGIGEAPNDGQEYVRKSLGWSVASGGGGGGGGGGKYMFPIDTPPTSPSSWNDEFSGTSLNTSIWTESLGSKNTSVFENEAYTVSTLVGANTSYRVSGITRDLAGPGTYEFALEWSGSSSQYRGPLLMVGNAAKNRFAVVMNIYHSAWGGTQAWGGFNAAAPFTTTTIATDENYAQSSTGTRVYIKLIVTSTTVSFLYSPNGRAFSHLVTKTISDYLSNVANVTLGLHNYTADSNKSSAMSVLWARKVA